MSKRKEHKNTKEREALMQMLFQMQSQKDFSETAFQQFTELHYDGEVSDFFRTVYVECRDHLEDIDQEMNQYSTGWPTTRMAEVDLSILRLALVEIHYLPEIPVKVSINEAVNLAKIFGTEKSSRFINGVLGKIVRDLDQGEKDHAS